MKPSLITKPFFALSFAALVAGCTVEEHTFVRGPERPAERVEVITVRPSPAYVWVAGRWERRRDGWEWISGHWERR